MKVTATEFKTNMGKYLDLVSQTDIYITMNGKVIATLTKPNHDRAALLDSLAGSLPEDSAARSWFGFVSVAITLPFIVI